ncbi:Sensor histidine kinase LiaS [Stieleria maiorica]|uniref:histidine kinase n=1 Tax=Stieleria maiorica TaxID=2795974 RepID=A0A5B9MG17_9BACT|nr:histidine kinase [Stieleria maiorica]QEF98545.1 Sensor histidine kinase LiaS [Stieleria maiorica]
MSPLPRILLALAAMATIVGAAVVFVIRAPAVESDAPLKRLSLSALERRLATLEEQLTMLAKPSMRTGVGAVGFRSIPQARSDHPEWIQISLSEQASIDQVVLVPMIWRDTAKGFRADGFPLEFSIRVGSDPDPNGTVVARFNADDQLLPRVAPVVISFPATQASWVRLEVARLSPRGWDDRHILQLSEILVFSGLDNLALRQSVQVSSSDQLERGLPRHQDYLVDGFVPYLMDAHDGEQSLAFVSRTSLGTTPVIEIDLRRCVPLSRIHLHATELSDNVPQALTDDFGIPRSMVVEGATESDFSDAVRLCDYQMHSIYDAGPIIMRRFPQQHCRYVRLIVNEPNTDSEGGPTQARVGFAEIEVISDGINVALGAPVTVNLDPDLTSRSASTLTDGNNLFGRILPIRDWMSELAMRHDLETERPRIAAELRLRYQRQKAILRRLSWLTGLLGFIAVSTVLAERSIRQRAVSRTRERIAADLHDELGANLHAIGLLGDLAQAAADSPDRLKPLLRRVRELTERSGAATRYCSNLLESEGLFGDLMEDMQRTSNRLLNDLEHTLTFEGEGYVRELKPSVRIDLFLFYKECLTNILRHSHATEVITHLAADRKGLRLTITDNGCGLNDSQISRIPGSLSRRARLAGAQVSASRLVGGGTKITLKLRTKKFGLLS